MENYSDCKTNVVIGAKNKTILDIPATFKILQNVGWLSLLYLYYLHTSSVCLYKVATVAQGITVPEISYSIPDALKYFITFYCNNKVVNLIIDQNSAKRKTVV